MKKHTLKQELKLQVECGILKPLPGQEDGFVYYKEYRLFYSDGAIMEYTNVNDFIAYCELYGDAMVENISADDETFSIMIDMPFINM